jgi:hypothetical protein
MLLHRSWKLAAVLIAVVATAYAGGFFLTIHAPSPTDGVQDAVLTVEAQGCSDYSHAAITGRAEGLVAGKRQSLPVTLAPANKPGMYTVRQQWPADGKWVLVLSAESQGRHTYTIVELAPDGRLQPASAPSKGIRMAMRTVTDADIEAALHGSPGGA